MKYQNLINSEDLGQIIDLQQKIVTSRFSHDELLQFICQETMNLTHAAGAVVELLEAETWFTEQSQAFWKALKD